MKLKQLILAGIISCIAFSPLSAFAEDKVVFEKTLSQSIGKNATYKNIRQLSEYGYLNINLMEIDLKDTNLDFDVIYNKEGFNKRATLSKMLSQSPEVIGAVNGDFFSMSNPGFALGPMIQNFKPISSPHYELNKYASTLISADKQFFFTYVDPTIVATSQNTQKQVYVSAINKPSKNFANIVMYTNEYYANSPGAATYKDMCEVVVENNIVKEVRISQPSTSIPSNGYVLLASGANSWILRDAFSIGDTISLDAKMVTNYNNIKTAIGNGTMILQNGQITKFTQSVAGKSQRTAMGVTYDNRLLIMTVDGRTSPHRGMNEYDVAYYLQGQGVKDGVMLDGGGSTEMIVTKEIRNESAKSAERALVNGFAVVNRNSKLGFDSMDGFLDSNFGYVGQKIKLDLSFFDSAKNILDIPPSSAHFSGEGFTGKYENGYFIPTSAGEGNIIVEYMNKTLKLPLRVVSQSDQDPNFVTEPYSNWHKEKAGISDDSTIDIAVLPDFSLLSELGKYRDKLVLKYYQDYIQKNSDAVIFANNLNTSFESGFNIPKILLKGGYLQHVINPTTLAINLDTSSSSLYKASGQWNMLKNSLNSNYKNIIISLNSTKSFAFEKENSYFKEVLTEAAKNKNIYVIYPGSTFTKRIEGNVHFVSIAPYKGYFTKSENFRDDYRYLHIKFSNDQTSFAYKKIFEDQLYEDPTNPIVLPEPNAQEPQPIQTTPNNDELFDIIQK